MQNHFGSAIRSNKGKLNQMHDAIQAILKHMVQKEAKSLEERHALCPKDNLTWCKFWQDEKNKTETYSEEHRLSSVFLNVLKPTFGRLSDVTLLQRCLKGITQNQNESLHGTVWKSVLIPVLVAKGKLKLLHVYQLGISILVHQLLQML